MWRRAFSQKQALVYNAVWAGLREPVIVRVVPKDRCRWMIVEVGEGRVRVTTGKVVVWTVRRRKLHAVLVKVGGGVFCG